LKWDKKPKFENCKFLNGIIGVNEKYKILEVRILAMMLKENSKMPKKV